MTDMTPSPEPGGALAELRDDAGSRKSFLRMAGGGAAGALAVVLAACGDDEPDNSTSTSTSGGGGSMDDAPSDDAAMQGDLEILNYALTLEHLEATFYQEVIDAGIVENPMIAELAKVVGQHEADHVDALTATIEGMGGKPAMAPETRFGPVIEQGLETVLETAATVENLGAAAYFGQAGRIKNKEVLAAALSIHSVEARHAAALNMLVGRGYTGNNPLEGSIPDGAFAKPMSMAQVLKAVQPYLA